MRFSPGCNCCAEPCTYPDHLCYTITDSPYFSGTGVMDYQTSRPTHIPAWTKNLAFGCVPFGDTEGYFDRVLHHQFDCDVRFSMGYSPATGSSVDFAFTDSYYWYLWFPPNFSFAYIIQLVHRVGVATFHQFPFGATSYVPMDYWGWFGEGHFDTYQSCGVNICEPPDNVYILSFPTYFQTYCPVVGCCPTLDGAAYTGDSLNPQIAWIKNCQTPDVVCPNFAGSMFIEIYTCDDVGSADPVGRLGLIGGTAGVSFTPFNAGATGSKSLTGSADATCSYMDFTGGGGMPARMFSGEAGVTYQVFEHPEMEAGLIGFSGSAGVSIINHTGYVEGALFLSGITDYRIGYVSTNKGQAIMRFRGTATANHGQSSNPLGRVVLSGSAGVSVSGRFDPVGKLIISGLASTGWFNEGGGL